jgi:cell division septum initiation protein DivIVA
MGAGDMKSGCTCWRVLPLFVVIFIGSVSSVQSQDVFREMDQLKKQVSDLKTEVANLRSMVYDLRSAVLKTVSGSEQPASKKETPKEGKAVKPTTPADEKQITKLACQAVGKFFTEAEASVRAGSPSAAEERMKKALQHMNSVLEEYAKTHRVSKLLSIYEGLTWDTYVAVQLRHSVQGNEDFLKALRRHKQKYIETCPKE